MKAELKVSVCGDVKSTYRTASSTQMAACSSFEIFVSSSSRGDIVSVIVDNSRLSFFKISVSLNLNPDLIVARSDAVPDVGKMESFLF